jgi:C-terminal processing protease CtpA/Prc
LYALNGRYISSTIINSVVDSKPAQLAGILPNDKVISIDGELG